MLARTRSGIATFGYLSRARQKHGKASIRFNAPGLRFRADHVASQVMQGTRIRYQERTLNGAAGYTFMLSTIAQAKQGEHSNRFRIRIWHRVPGSRTDMVDYDNLFDQRASSIDVEGPMVNGAGITPSPD